MATRAEWNGTAAQLLEALAEFAGERVAKAKSWPDGPKALTNRMRRAATFLRSSGIEIIRSRDNSRARTRMISISTRSNSLVPEEAGAASSASSVTEPDHNYPNGSGALSQWTIDSGPNDDQEHSCAHPDDADAADAGIAQQTADGKSDTPGWKATL
jgi:hypothetical protein